MQELHTYVGLVERALTYPGAYANPDLDLVRRIAQRDERALEALSERYGRRLYAYALRLTQNPDLAGEVLQDTLLAVWQGARSFRGDSRVVTWLLGIVHNQAMNAIRRRSLYVVDLETMEAAHAEGGQPDDEAQALERQATLARALARLSVEHRSVVELVFYQELSLAEVAKVCGCPVGTVKSRLSYAKAHLRRALEGAGLHQEDLL